MGMIKTAVRMQLVDLPTPTAVFERLNEVLPTVKEPQMYATCTALHIQPGTNDAGCRVDYAIAGQPAMLLPSGDGSVSRLADEQLPLGLLTGPPYRGQSTELHPGDVLVVATDGILEAAGPSDEEFGLEQLEALLKEHSSLPLPSIVREIHSKLKSYHQDDDQSLLLVRLQGLNRNASS